VESVMVRHKVNRATWRACDYRGRVACSPPGCGIGWKMFGVNDRNC